MLKTIENATDRAAKMLEDLRSRMVEVPIKVERTNLKELIEIALTEHYIPPTVQVKLYIGDGFESVMLDPSKIRRVLDNLVRNALEAMPDGGSMQVNASLKSDKIVIEVSDTGCGIPEKVKPTLFRPFSSSKPKGTGLGLYYCKKAVEASGGKITFASSLNQGTTFRIELPARIDVEIPSPTDALIEREELDLADTN
jgi:signal transduction histidine kinase